MIVTPSRTWKNMTKRLNLLVKNGHGKQLTHWSRRDSDELWTLGQSR